MASWWWPRAVASTGLSSMDAMEAENPDVMVTLARYFSSRETTVNSTSRAGRAMPYATTCTTQRTILNRLCTQNYEA